MKQPVVILDNGASAIKLGTANSPTNSLQQNVKTFPNAIIRSKGDKRTFFGLDFIECSDFAGLHYRLPFEKGYLTDWDAQKAVWDGVLRQEFLGFDPRDSSVLVTEPYFNLPNIQEIYDQFMFEEYEFAGYHRSTPAALMPHGQLFKTRGLPPPECLLIVDAGFSFTHVIPIINGAIQWTAVKRIDVGGKILTNHLKELVSYTQWNMMEETHIVNDIKEACCFVSQDFSADLESCRQNSGQNHITQEYVLPDFSLNKRGRIRERGEASVETGQIMRMGNERFSVPEILFHPTYLGLDQAGIATVISQSIALMPEDLQGMFWSNIGLIGGSAKFPGLAQRLVSELRPLAPAEAEVMIYESKDAVLEACHSAIAFAKSSKFQNHVVTREEYLENGSNACRRKFHDWKGSAESFKGKARARVDASDDETSSGAQAKAHKTRTRTTSGVKRR